LQKAIVLTPAALTCHSPHRTPHPAPLQFNNPANPRAHAEGTGPEIWEQMGGRVDAFVAGVGSGGTLAGVGAFLRSKNPGVEIVLADPVGSVLAPLVQHGTCGASRGERAGGGSCGSLAPRHLVGAARPTVRRSLGP
jgi:cysteine synthase